MAPNKTLSQCSGPKDATLSLSSGERVDLWVNKDIFSSNGSLNKQQEFTDVDNTPLLTFQWSEEIPITTVTNWTLTVTSSSSERRREFAQSSAEVLGCNQWEMVQAVMESCYRNFGAYLLEVSFWNVRLGHRDCGSARRASDHQTCLVTDDLKCLFDDTEYKYLDIMIEWSVSLPPGTQTPVQESSTVVSQDLSFNNGITTDGPGSVLHCFTRRYSEEQHHLPDLTDIDEKQLLKRVLEEVLQIRYSVHQINVSVSDFKQKVRGYHMEVCETLGTWPHSSSLPSTPPGGAAGALMLGPLDQETPPRPQQEQYGRDHAPQLCYRSETENPSDNHSSTVGRPHTSEDSGGGTRAQQDRRGRAHALPSNYNSNQGNMSDGDNNSESRLHGYSSHGNPAQPPIPQQSQGTSEMRYNSQQKSLTQRDRSRDTSSEGRRRFLEASNEPSETNPPQSQPPRPRESTQNDVMLNLMADDDNSTDRHKGKRNIKKNHAQPKQVNNHTPTYAGGSGTSPLPARDSTNFSPLNTSRDGWTTSNLPPSPRSPPSVSGPQPGRQQNSPPANQRSFAMQQVTTMSSQSPAAGFGAGAARHAGSPQSLSNGASAALSSSARPQSGGGRRDGGHQKESFIGQDRVGVESVEERHTKSEAQEGLTLLVETRTEARLVRESVERAYREDAVKPPKARSFDTMLCLDISDSMTRGGAFGQMKKMVLDFIEGVEDIVTTFGVEENMGLVTFGGRANVVQNLTNDFNLIRDKIEQMQPGGKSPFVEALLVSMAAFVKKGGIVSVSGEWQVKPRIIFISDGVPTESAENDDRDDAYNIGNVRLSLSNLLVSFKKGDKFNKVHPLFFIPVGRHADKKYMETMSKICDGVYLEPHKIRTLCHYFRVQETVGKVLVCLRRESEQMRPEKIDATLMALTPDLSAEEKSEVMEIVHQELTNPNRIRPRNPKPHELDYVYEAEDKVKEGKRLPLGTRVIQGPDWSYGDQDGGRPGTVINHHEIHSVHWVKWDHGDYNRYGYSHNRGFDIWKTDDHPRLRKDDEPLEIGMAVKKSKDWRPAEGQAEQGEGRGIIIRKSSVEGKVMVRWSNGVIQVCQWSPVGIQEVDYSPPQEDTDNGAQLPKSKPNAQDHPESGMAVFEGQGSWQWCDENNVWHDYDAKINQEIEAACKKKNCRSCIIDREGKMRRVMFRKMVEKLINDGSEYKVQRLQIP